jgi:tetratricopeptide (TPR) repeat protein
MRFRLALCGFGAAPLESFREADGRWVDTYFFEGRREMLRYPTPDVGKAADLYLPAHEAFPESTAITLGLANARNALSEYEVALSLFDSVLAQFPTHRDALMGRILSLSYLGRHYDGIAAASRMIDLGTYHQGDAYYWRAWNRYNVHDLPPAWNDVERATQLMVHTSVYTLAGFIAYARNWPETAIDRFDRAYRLDNTNCEAVWTEGLVHVDQDGFARGASKFATSVKCFATAAEQARREVAANEKAELADNVKARRIAAAQKRIETSEHRRAQAAFNAASCYARVGQKSEATSFIDLAAEHPLMREKAAALKATIDKLPS